MSIREDKLIEDPNVGYNEDLEAIKEASQKLMNGEDIEESPDRKLLDEDYKRTKKYVTKKKKLEKELAAFEILNQDNEVLQKYMKLLKDLEEANKGIDDAKKTLYEEMLKVDESKYECEDYKVTLKKPYIKREFNSEAFYEDYAPNSRMYKKYVNEKEVKGNVTIKIID